MDPMTLMAGANVASGLLGMLGGGSGAAKRAAAHAARQAADMQARSERQQRDDLAPYRNSGGAATTRLSQLMGLDAFDRNSIAQQLAKQNPALFAQEATPQARMRAPGSINHRLYGDGAEVLINGQWVSGPGETERNYSDEQNAAIDAEIARLKGEGDYGKLTKEFTLDDYEEDPGYQFRLEEGNKALERAQARRGGFFSGAAMKEANRFNSGQASQEYAAAYDRFNSDNNTLYNRLAGISNSGQGAVNTGVQSSQNASNNYQNILGQLGSYNASDATAKQNLLNQGMANIGSSLSGMMGGGRSAYNLPWLNGGRY